MGAGNLKFLWCLMLGAWQQRPEGVEFLGVWFGQALGGHSLQPGEQGHGFGLCQVPFVFNDVIRAVFVDAEELHLVHVRMMRQL